MITAIKFLRETDDQIDTKENWSLRLLRKFVPTTEKIEGPEFFVKENGIRKVTPLFMALVVIEATDLVFAVDSIPAVFAVTQDSFVAFASNILAILGLRALYFVLADGLNELKYLKPGWPPFWPLSAPRCSLLISLRFQAGCRFWLSLLFSQPPVSVPGTRIDALESSFETDNESTHDSLVGALLYK